MEKWNEKNKSSIDEEEEEEEDEGEATLNGDIDLEGMNEQFLKVGAVFITNKPCVCVCAEPHEWYCCFYCL